MQFIKFFDKTYKVNVWVFLNCTEEEFCLQLFKLTKIEEKPSGGCSGRYICLGGDSFDIHAIWVPKFDQSLDNYKYLVHKLIHMVFKVSDDRGCLLSFEASESIAYYIEYLISEISKGYKESIAKIKAKKKTINGKLAVAKAKTKAAKTKRKTKHEN